MISRDVTGTASPQGLLVALTTTDPTLIHQAPAEPNRFDRVKIYAVNIDAADREVSIWWGNSSDPGAEVPMTIPAGAGPCLIIDDWPIERGQAVYAEAVTANTINISTLITPVRSL
jgi:hypothetical protein